MQGTNYGFNGGGGRCSYQVGRAVLVNGIKIIVVTSCMYVTPRLARLTHSFIRSPEHDQQVDQRQRARQFVNFVIRFVC